MNNSIIKMSLYVGGSDKIVQRQVKALTELLENLFGDGFELTIVNIVEQPGMARQHSILSLPTLIKEWPEPAQRFVGDLSSIQVIAQYLGSGNSLE